MRCKPIIPIIVTLLLSLSAAAQNAIDTDRPDQSDGVNTVPAGRWQVENGVTMANGIATNNLMVRLGIGKSTEARFLTDVGKVYNDDGMLPITFSMKQKIISGKKFVPAITFVGYASHGKLASKDFQTSELSYDLTLAFENPLSKTISAGYNFGTVKNLRNYRSSVTFGFSLFGDASLFVEYFALFPERTMAEHNFDFGILYPLRSNLQIDFAVGHYIDNDNDGLDERFFSTLGVSYLFIRD